MLFLTRVVARKLADVSSLYKKQQLPPILEIVGGSEEAKPTVRTNTFERALVGSFLHPSSQPFDEDLLYSRKASQRCLSLEQSDQLGMELTEK